MIDIAEKLFPNVLTILTQLVATGIIYYLYRKYVHVHVLAYLDRQAADLDKAQNYAKVVETEAAEKSQTLEQEHQIKMEQLERSQKMMRQEAEQERAAIIEKAEAERDLMLQQAQNEINKERAALMEEMEQYVLGLAVDVTERTLEHYTYDEEEVFQALEKEWEQMTHETH